MEYRYRPRPANKRAVYLATALGVAAILLLGMSMLDVVLTRSIWQCGFLVLSVATLYILLRYVLSSYLYTVTDSAGEPMLIVRQVQGRRLSIHCRLALANILRIVDVEDAESEEGQRALADFRAERIRYSYLATMGNVPTQIVYGREGGQRFAIRLEGNRAFADMLRAEAERARQNAPAEEEEDDD